MRSTKVLLNILSFVCFIFGALYCFSLVFIPVGVYCFLAGKLFSKKADHLMDNFISDKKTMKAYTIFVSIVCFPLGLISIIVCIKLYGNNVKVENLHYEKIIEADPVTVSTEENKTEKEIANENEETEDEKQEKLTKLKNFLDKGIISQDEFDMAKDQLFKKDN